MGGPQIGDLKGRPGKEPSSGEGLRVTDAETLDIARMVLVGKVNRDRVVHQRHGALAVGLLKEDAGLIEASARHLDLGFVGDVKDVNPAIVERLLVELIPVVSTIGSTRLARRTTSTPTPWPERWPRRSGRRRSST